MTPTRLARPLGVDRQTAGPSLVEYAVIFLGAVIGVLVLIR